MLKDVEFQHKILIFHVSCVCHSHNMTYTVLSMDTIEQQKEAEINKSKIRTDTIIRR